MLLFNLTLFCAFGLRQSVRTYVNLNFLILILWLVEAGKMLFGSQVLLMAFLLLLFECGDDIHVQGVCSFLGFLVVTVSFL